MRLFSAVLLVLASASSLAATERLFEQEPFDRVTLDQEGGNVILKVVPLDLPGRRIPENPPPTSKLRLRLFSRPEVSYEVLWQHVAHIELFEEAVLIEAERLVAAGKFDEAFDYYDFLLQNYKELPRLADSVEEYLSKNAAASYQAGQYDDTLSLLFELHRRNPNRPGLAKALDRVADKLIQRHVDKQDYASARAALQQFAAVLPTTQGTTTHKWLEYLKQEAGKWLTKARTHFAAGRNRDALKAISEARAIWPHLEGVDTLVEQLYAIHSQIIVGTTLPAGEHLTARLDDWASRRSARLIRRPLFELRGYSTEGGQYDCPYGAVEQDDSGLHLLILLRQGIRTSAGDRMLTGYDVSQKLLALADPAGQIYRSAWDDLLRGVAVEDVYRVHVDLGRPHVRPEALLLETSAEGDAGGERWAANGPYRVADRTDQQVRYVVNEASLNAGATTTNAGAATTNAGAATTKTAEIVEQWFTDADDAVQALERGEIDLVDRISPRRIATLESSEQIAVGQYRLPTVHVLIPNADKPLVGNREFRRALVYGINRQAILEKVLLGGQPRQGFVIVSGPFAVGESQQDPIAYATDRQIEPRSYEPRLALMLATLAKRTLASRSGDTENNTVEMPALVLAHPSDSVARAACQAIRHQLSLIGIPITLHELEPDDLATSSVDYDLLYAELMMWEPVVDSRILLGENGMTGSCSSYMSLALRKLDTARNWTQVRSRLRDVHRVAHNDVAVIPLWQTINHFAYRKSLTNVGDRLISLYQNVEQWERHFDR